MKNLLKGEQIEYLGYTILNCKNNDGIVLLSSKGNHCGNFGDDIELACRYALLNYMCDKYKLRSTIITRLNKSSGGHWGDYDLLLDCINQDNLEIPSDIKMTNGMNRMIDLG